eukprot:6261786-Amphidinium_carterae.5
MQGALDLRLRHSANNLDSTVDLAMARGFSPSSVSSFSSALALSMRSISCNSTKLPCRSSSRPRRNVQLVEGGMPQCGAKVSNFRSGAHRPCHQKHKALPEARKFAAVLSLGIPAVSCL